jgi:hypothetical protein
MTTSLAADGSAAASQTTFDSKTTSTIICVVSLADTGQGTTIAWAHVNEKTNSYFTSQIFQFQQPLKHFYVQYKAPPGGTLTPGSYMLRFYLNSRFGGSIEYTVT